jgi:aspartate racemase
LLATTGTVRAGFYQRLLAAPGRQVILPPASIQERITEAILAVKAGDVARGTALAVEASDAMLGLGADRLLLACTELPVAMKDMPQEQHCIDATACLAEACVAFWLNGEADKQALPDATVPGKEDSQWISGGFRTF